MHKRDLPFAAGTIAVAALSIVVWRALPSSRPSPFTHSHNTEESANSTAQLPEEIRDALESKVKQNYIADDIMVEVVFYKRQNDFQLKLYASERNNGQLSSNQFKADLATTCPADPNDRHTITLKNPAYDNHVLIGSLSSEILQSCRVVLRVLHKQHRHRWLLHNIVTQ